MISGALQFYVDYHGLQFSTMISDPPGQTSRMRVCIEIRSSVPNTIGLVMATEYCQGAPARFKAELSQLQGAMQVSGKFGRRFKSWPFGRRPIEAGHTT